MGERISAQATSVAGTPTRRVIELAARVGVVGLAAIAVMGILFAFDQLLVNLPGHGSG